MFSSYTRLYKQTKCVTLGLEPVDQTKELIRKSAEQLGDKDRNDMYTKVRDQVLNEAHRAWLGTALSRCADTLDFASFVDELKSADDDFVVRKAFFSKFVDTLKSTPGYDFLFSSKIFSNLELMDTNLIEATSMFDGFFTAYFDKYNKIRKACYENVLKAGSVSARVNENITIWLQNQAALETPIEGYETMVSQFLEKDKPAQNPGELLLQDQIDEYNAFIGRFNMASSEYRQVNGLHKGFLLTPLKKQLLSDKETVAFKPYETDEDVISAITDLPPLRFSDLEDIFASVCQTPNGAYFIKGIDLPEFSRYLGHRWNTFRDAIRESIGFKSKKNEGEEQQEERFGKIIFRLNEIEAAVRERSWFGDVDLATACLQTVRGLGQLFAEKKTAFDKFLSNRVKDKPLAEQGKAEIRAFLDAAIVIDRFLRLFRIDTKTDASFAGGISNVRGLLSVYVRTYNRFRNYITKKPYGNSAKQRIFFGIATLGSGWSDSNGIQNSMVLLRRHPEEAEDGFYEYYIAVANKNAKKGGWIFLEPNTGVSGSFERLEYHLFKDVARNIPRCSIKTKEARKAFESGEAYYTHTDAKSFLHPFQISREFYDMSDSEYGCPKYKKAYLRNGGSKGVYDECVKKWIAFCYDFLKVYRSTAIFNPDSLLPLSQYETVEDFNCAVDQLCYSFGFPEMVSAESMEKMLSEERCFLFRVSNKTLQVGYHGHEDSHTTYFKALFEKDKNGIPLCRLNGGANLFYRPAMLDAKDAYTHQKGSVLVNKYTKDGDRIPGEIYKEILRYTNGSLAALSEEARKYYARIVTREAPRTLVKDNRFTKEHYELSVPLEFNNGAEGGNINEDIRRDIQGGDIDTVVAVYRGKQNLLCTAVVQNNKILELNDYAFFNNIPYKKILRALDDEKRSAQSESWEYGVKNKDIVDAFVRQAVSEVARLCVKYNAVCIVESTYGVHKGTLMEQRMYDRFVSMLTQKLAYYIDKNIANGLPGSATNGLQLVSSDTVSKAWQNGILFSVSPSYCEGRDPFSGFYQAFDFSGVTNTKSRREFFALFDSIAINRNGDVTFRFDYRNVPSYACGSKTDWVVSSAGTRLEFDKNDKKIVTVSPSEELRALFSDFGISTKPGEHFPEILSLDDSISNAAFWSNLERLFRLSTKMQNLDYRADKNIFVDVTSGYTRPETADEIAAINFAGKGIQLLNRIAANSQMSEKEIFWFGKDDIYNMPLFE